MAKIKPEGNEAIQALIEAKGRALSRLARSDRRLTATAYRQIGEIAEAYIRDRNYDSGEVSTPGQSPFQPPSVGSRVQGGAYVYEQNPYATPPQRRGEAQRFVPGASLFESAGGSPYVPQIPVFCPSPGSAIGQPNVFMENAQLAETLGALAAAGVGQTQANAAVSAALIAAKPSTDPRAERSNYIRPQVRTDL